LWCRCFGSGYFDGQYNNCNYSEPTDQTACTGDDAIFAVAADGGALTYQWQESTDGGANFSDVTDGGDYAGTTTDSLTVANSDNAKDTYQYQVVVSGACGADTSAMAVLTVNITTAITTEPTDQVACEGDDAVFAVVSDGGALTYQWQESTDSGANYSDVTDGGDYTGATTDALTVANSDNAKDTYQYQVIVSGTCGADTSVAAVLTVNIRAN